ncbi:MAG: hypothetical protein HRU28_11215 [Rhizobiales bacterium]|nr:hypothetical protein [Hyphomicrobiales bacterium]
MLENYDIGHKRRKRDSVPLPPFDPCIDNHLTDYLNNPIVQKAINARKSKKIRIYESKILPKIDSYFDEFSNSKLRDSLFVSSLSHVERDESIVDKILEYCGALNNEKQMRLYINTRLYADIFKQVSLAGSILKNRPTNNKNRAINLALKHIFPFWESDFLIACVLADHEQVSKFMMLWTHIKSINFIDDTKNEQTSLEDENIILEFMRKFNMILKSFNSTIYCCSKHKLVKGIYLASKCGEPDSINQMCIVGFGKPLKEIINYG